LTHATKPGRHVEVNVARKKLEPEKWRSNLDIIIRHRQLLCGAAPWMRQRNSGVIAAMS
jgi:hypothetical protein